jgi:23S rRNA pseudouridine1911/1915/1917 synthase
MTPDVVYLDNHLLVVNKPPGLLVQGDRTRDPDLLTLSKEYLKERFARPGNVFVGLVHRLDRPVSGLVVLARTSKAAARLSKQFRERTVQKIYLALVEGRIPGGDTLVDYLLKEDESVRVVGPDHPGAQRAELAFRVLAAERERTLVEVDLSTGRSHQIRLQFAHRGHPVVGDVRYGARSRHDGRNIALHAHRLGVAHPTRPERMEWAAPPPEGWPALG